VSKSVHITDTKHTETASTLSFTDALIHNKQIPKPFSILLVSSAVRFNHVVYILFIVTILSVNIATDEYYIS